MSRPSLIWFRRVLASLCLLTLGTQANLAQTTFFTYQGKLTDAGNPANGTYDLQFRLFDALIGGNQITTTVIREDIAVSNGVFTVTLDFGAAAFPGANRWLEIGVRPGVSAGAFTTLSPLQPISATPYAIRSLSAASAESAATATTTDALSAACVGCVTNAKLADGSVTDAKITAVAGSKLTGTIPVASVPAGSGNYIQNTTTQQVTSNFNISGNGTLGGVLMAIALNSNALRQELTTYTPNIINGFMGTGSGGATPGNRVTAGVVGASIGGGGFNGTLNFPAGDSISGDNSNRVSDWFGTVGGGLLNRAGNFDAVLDNARYTTIAGGYFNLASSSASTVGGGLINQATGENATVSGGFFNTASGVYASVGGGYFNSATAIAATVPGGTQNEAFGNYSYAAGRRAKANHEGTFVWADPTPGDFASSGNNQFLIRASGGVGIGTNAPTQQLHVNGNSLFATNGVNGVRITPAADADVGVFNVTNAANTVNWLSVGSSGKVIMNGGNVGIGTGSPTHLLSVNGDASKAGGGTWAVFSDERLKHIRGKFTPGLQALMKLQPIWFEYKADNALGLKAAGETVGFSAQAVAAVLPEAVTKTDSGYLQLNSDPILWTMLNSIKEQQAQIQQLLQANQCLQRRLTQIERRSKTRRRVR